MSEEVHKKKGRKFGLKGYQKRVVHIKNTRSPYFEEAYFVIKSESGGILPCNEAMVAEANRIINENFGIKGCGFFRNHKRWLSGFAVGAALSLIPVIILIF